MINPDQPGTSPTNSHPLASDESPAADGHSRTGYRHRTVPGTWPRWWRVAAAVLAVSAVVVELIVLLSARDRLGQLDALNSARAGALAAARTYSVEVASYDYRQLDRDFGTVERNSTQSFAATFRQSSKALDRVLTQYHAIAQAHVIAAGLESATTTRAVATVFINQTVTNTTQKTPTTDQSRIEITLLRQRGRWLIDQLKLL